MTDSLHDNLDQFLKGQAHSLAQIMQRNILTCAPDLSVAEAADQMVTTRCSSIVVLEGGKPVGIWTEHDALLVNPDHGHELDRAVGEVMSQPVRTINQSVTIEAATLRFRDEGLRHYVVTDDADHLVGVVSQSDVVRQHDVRHFLSMRSVGSVIRRSTLILQASSTLSQAAARLHHHGTDCAVVIFGDGRRGIVTERDLLKAVARRKSGLKVGDVSNTPIFSVPQTVSVLDARETMERKGIRHLGVTDGEGTPVGLLSYADILASVEFSILRYVEEMLEERSRALSMTQNRLRGALDQLNRTNEELEEFVQSVSDGFSGGLKELSSLLEQGNASAFEQARAKAAALQDRFATVTDFVDVGRAHPQSATVDLAKIVGQVLADLSERGVLANAHVAPLPGLPRLKGDEALFVKLFKLIFENLLSLAVPGQPLSLRLYSERQDGCWLLGLSSSGLALQPGQADQLSRLFWRQESSGKTMVGLALAKRIVERMGGRFWIDSNPSAEITIRLSLSVVEASPPS